tara:strand:+ start:2835 stop:3251 length:417 start_codon:yes stop_codon:yes gene_type:complete
MGIQSKELRIGNLVLDRGGKLILIDHWEYEDKVSTKRKEDSHPLTEFVDYLTPIPLTEEWLLKFGFENIRGNFFKSKIYGNDEYILIDLNQDCDNVYLKQINTDGENDAILLHNEIKYVHQLQNLYFALTNVELEINL